MVIRWWYLNSGREMWHQELAMLLELVRMTYGFGLRLADVRMSWLTTVPCVGALISWLHCCQELVPGTAAAWYPKLHP
jgi:hypothetical protein